MHFRFLHVFLWLNSSFYHWNTVHCMDVPQFIYPVTCWRTSWLLPSFQVLAIMKSDVIRKNSLSRFLCGCKFSAHLGKYQRAWLMLKVCLVLQETAKLSSIVAVPFCILTSNEWEFLLLHIWCCQCFGHSKVCNGWLNYCSKHFTAPSSLTLLLVCEILQGKDYDYIFPALSTVIGT